MKKLFSLCLMVIAVGVMCGCEKRGVDIVLKFPMRYYMEGRTNYISEDGKIVVIGPNWCNKDEDFSGYGEYPMAIVRNVDGKWCDPKFVSGRVIEAHLLGGLIFSNKTEHVVLDEGLRSAELNENGIVTKLVRVLQDREPMRPCLTPQEAVEIYARDFGKWYLNMPFANRGTSFHFVDFDEDGVLELIREDCDGTGHYTSSTIYRIMPDNSVRSFIITRKRDFSCFFSWDGADVLRREDGELLWLLGSLITSNAVGSQCYYTTGVVRRLGCGFFGDEFAEREENYQEKEEGEFTYRIRNEISREWEETDAETYQKKINDFCSHFKIAKAVIPKVEIDDDLREADSGVKNALLKAYCGFGYDGYPHQDFILDTSVGVRFQSQDDTGDFAEFVINGDAEQAARCCYYPLRVNIGPLVPKIRNELEFVKWFPIVFDMKARKQLKGCMDDGNGWNFHNWQGEMFGNGQLWRDYDTKKIIAVNIISESLFSWWQKAYRKDLATLASEYREGCVWPACYFKSTDGAYFGRMDSLGEPWTIVKGAGTSAGCRVSSKFRIMLFKRGQSVSDRPWRVFVWDEKDDPEYGSVPYDEIFSEKYKFSFWRSDTTQFPADYGLEYHDEKDKKVVLEVDACDWPPYN